MPDRYQSLFGASRTALDPALAAPEWVEEGIFLVNKRTGERRLKQIPGAEPGLGKVPTPDTSLSAIAKEALGLAGATAADVNVGTARLPSQVLKATADTLKRGAGNLDPRSRQKKGEKADAYMQLFGTPGAAEAVEASREARELQLDPLRPAAELTARWTEEGRERLAETTQNLPTPLAVGIHQGAVMAGMLADPTLGAGAGKAPSALSEAAQEAAIAAGKRPGLGARAGAALQKGYGKLLDLDAADAALRDNLNRLPGYRQAHYQSRLDEVEIGLQGLREVEDAAPIPPYFRGGDRAPQAPPAASAVEPYEGFPSSGPVRKAKAHEPLPLPKLTGAPVGSPERAAIADAWATVSSRYPRITASIQELRIDPEIPGWVGAQYMDGIIASGVPEDLANPGVLLHELTHAAQDLRGKLPRQKPPLREKLALEAPAYKRYGLGADVNVAQPAPPGVDLEAALRGASDAELAKTLRSLEAVEKLDSRGEALYEAARREIQKRSRGSYLAQREIQDSMLPPGVAQLANESEVLAQTALQKQGFFGPYDPLTRSPAPAWPGGETPSLTRKPAPPGPEAQGGVATARDQAGSMSRLGTGASPPFRGQVAASLQDEAARAAFPESVAPPPLGPRPGSGEAGFIKLRPDPLPPADAAAKEAAWQMRKEYAATERLGRYRAGSRAEELQKLIPKETDEALTWMFHELGDPRSYKNRPPEVQARIAKKTAARRRVIDRVLADPNAEPALQEVVAWREQTKAMWEDLSDMWDLGFVKNYVHMTYEPPKGVKTVNPMSFGSVGTTPGLVRERAFLNPAQAMAVGWTPRTLRFSQLRAETEKVFAHAQAIRGLVDDLATMPLLQDGRPALTYATMGKQPKGYIRVSGVPVLEKAAQRSPSSSRALPEAVRHAELLQAESRRAAETAGGFFRYTPEGGVAPSVIEQPMLPGTEKMGAQPFRPPRTPTTPSDLWVHPQVWEELKPVLDVAEPLKIDRFLGTVKRVKFLGSIFHPFELGLAAMQSMGPVKGAKAWASRGGGLPGLAQLAERRGWATPFTQEVAEKWVRRGLGVEAPSADMMTDAFQRAMVDWEDLMTRAAGKAGAVARAAGAAGKGLRVTANYYDEAIWKILHSPIKIAAAELWEAQFKAAISGDKRAMGVANRFLSGRTRQQLAAMSEEELGEAVASAINNHFGGQVWELSRSKLFSDPRALKWMRRVFLSPDWNVSAISSGLAPLSKDPVHRIIGRTYWTNITALAAGANALNYLLTMGSEQGPHFMWENEEGHKMDLETPFRTEKGRKIFYRVGKHAQELPHFAFGTPGAQQLRFTAGKTAPIVHAAAGLLGESVTEFPSPYEKLVRERERTGEVPGPVEEIAARLQPAAEMMLPFSAQDAEDPGDVLRKLLISIPESKGMSTYKAENLYAQALYDSDKPRQAEIIEILRQNGYDDEAIGFMIQGAQRKARRRLRAGR